jgi:hypothetical protein
MEGGSCDATWNVGWREKRLAGGPLGRPGFPRAESHPTEKVGKGTTN